MKPVLGTDPNFLTTLVEINHDITSTLDLDRLLKKIAALTNRITPYQIFAIFLVDQLAEKLELDPRQIRYIMHAMTTATNAVLSGVARAPDCWSRRAFATCWRFNARCVTNCTTCKLTSRRR